MTPNPSYFLAFSSARKPLLGVRPDNICATQSGCEPHQPQARGEPRAAVVRAFSRFLSA